MQLSSLSTFYPRHQGRLHSAGFCIVGLAGNLYCILCISSARSGFQLHGTKNAAVVLSWQHRTAARTPASHDSARQRRCTTRLFVAEETASPFSSGFSSGSQHQCCPPLMLASLAVDLVQRSPVLMGSLDEPGCPGQAYHSLTGMTKNGYVQ